MFKEPYDTMAEGWQVVLQNFNNAFETTGANAQAKSFAMRRFWSAQQAFFNQILTSMQMPSVIQDMKEKLAAGESCVLQIVNTFEAAQEREAARIDAEGGNYDDMDITPKGILIDLINKAFPVDLYEETGR